MNSKEIRQKYLDFFKEKGHAIIPSASLIPENDPTVLFTTAGMQPLVPYFLGEKHPEGKLLTNSQKCLRTDDIDEVGDPAHHTFFEMLGNWSLGGYFKEEAIKLSWEFLTDKRWLGLDKNRIAVSVFAGDSDAPFDIESYNIWKSLGVPEERIAELPKKNNWWGMATGPCGPDTEIFCWTGEADEIPESFDDDNELWVEIWNNVFIQYNKKSDNTLDALSQKNVDTGMGLERIVSVMNNLGDDYKTDLFIDIIKKIEEASGKKYDDNQKVFRIIADHIKAAVFMIADGLVPGKNGNAYVLRRLIRRAKYYYDLIEVEKSFCLLIEPVISIYKDIYPELLEKKDYIEKIIMDEEDIFVVHLGFGKKMLEKIIAEEKYISGDNAFLLYSTYGFPFELIVDIAKEKNIEVDIDDFNKKKLAHQNLSRTASSGMFKGGLADASEETTKLHTTAHLLLSALRKVLGDNVVQKGSNITSERLRFDFSYPEKMTDNQKEEVEGLINKAIEKELPVTVEEMNLDEAKKRGAMGVFESKYGEKVKVYTIGAENDVFSSEICGGPHVENIGKLGKFKIKKEESSSAGVRRIKAILS
ncbi:MAG: alanine--tRNA ligase [bacterium]